MGQTLSQPATDKHHEIGEDSRYAYALAEMQGWRISMEDAHAAVLNLEEDKPGSKINTFFAVYDGHGGSAAAKFAGQKVHQTLVSLPSYQAGRWSEALKRAFLDSDEEMKADSTFLRDPSGCTAVAALLTHDRKLLVANAGDSRSVLSVKGEVKAMSYDHKPQSETEKARIAGAGGYVEYGRVNGNLALSRALGDFEYKKNPSLPPEQQIITADPDIIEHDLSDEDEFLVLACDGIWDCLTSQQVVDIVRRKVAEGVELQQIAEFFCDHCLAPDTNSGAGIGCDNMTILIVALLNGRTKKEWYAWVKDRVERKYGYDTPAEVPQIFAQSRILAFQARQKAQQDRDERDGPLSNGFNNPNTSLGSLLASSGLGSFARVLGSGGGLSFHPGSGIISDTNNLVFREYGDSEEDSDEEMDTDGAEGHSFFGGSFGENTVSDSSKSLRAQLAELEHDLSGDEAEDERLEDATPGGSRLSPADASVTKLPDGVSATGLAHGETPPPSAPGKAGGPVKQLESHPLGDTPEPVLKAEGLLDRSEDPLKA